MQVVPLLDCCVRAWVVPTVLLTLRCYCTSGHLQVHWEKGVPQQLVGFNFLFFLHWKKQKAPLLYLLGVGEEGEGVLLGKNCCHCCN